MICAGIDAGSRSIKVVLFDPEQNRVLARGMVDQGIAQEQLAASLLADLCAQAGLDGAARTVIATGYGRHALKCAQTTITEITCHARGVHHLDPDIRTVIEIGGQDSKCISLEAGGRVRDFGMNDRCAAGSGRFLEVVAARLGLDLPGLSALSRGSTKPALISSMCVVFAETEIIGLLAQGVAPADIAAGVQNAIASRVSALAGRAFSQPVCFTGGVALQPGMVRALEAALGCPVRVPASPQYTGALGAAILGARKEQAARAAL